jgi:hypothetical protein
MFAAGAYGQTSGVPPLVSGDCSVGSNGVMTCTKTNAVPFAASATMDTTNAANISNGTLPVARTAAISGDVTKAAGAGSSTVTGVNGAAVPLAAGIVATNTSGQIVAATATQARALVCSGTPSQYYYCDPSTGTWTAIASSPAVSSAVAIIGGAINGTPIGFSAQSSGSFTVLTNSGQATSTAASAVSTPARLDTGAWFTGGTAATTTPHWLIQPAGSAAASWSTTGTALGINAASGSSANFLDFRVNGTSSVFSVDASGNTVASRYKTATGFFNLTQSTYLQPSANTSTAWTLNAPFTAAGILTSQANTGGISAPLYTPASSVATCSAGTVAWDASYLYVCRATNTWSRAALSTF